MNKEWNQWMNRLMSGTRRALVLLFVMRLFSIPVYAADIGKYEAQGSVTVDDQYYDRNGDTSTSGFLSRYQYYPEEEKYNRLNVPNLDLMIRKNGAEYPSFHLQRFAPWLKNDRMLLAVDPAEGVKIDLDYMRYRKNMDEYAPITTGLAGSNYTAQFNNDASTSEFFVERSKTDLSMMLNSSVWGGTEGGLLNSVNVWVNNEDKRGRKFLTYILDGSDVSASGISSRWRGRAEPFDSRVVNIGTELNIGPVREDDLRVFLNAQRENFQTDDLYTLADAAALDSNMVSSAKSIDFVPESEKDAYSLDLVDRLNDLLSYRFGIRYADLDQESYNALQDAAGYNGEIKLTTLLASATYTGIRNTDLTGFYHYNQRENSSQAGTSGYKDLDSNVSDPHVAEITSRKYGGDATYRMDRYNTVVRLSGRRDQTDREFQRPTGSAAIASFSSPYSIDSDRWIYSASLYSRLYSDLLITASASYEDAGDTALILEPDKSWNGRIMADYSLLKGRAAVSASYTEGKQKNDNFTWFGAAGTNLDKNASNSVDHDWESRHRSISLDGWWQVRDDLNLFAAYMRDALLQDANWLLSDKTRWSALNTFVMQEDALGFQSYSDTYTLGASYQLNPKANLLISFLLSNSRSRIQSGTTDLGALTKIDNQYQNVNLGLNLIVSDRSDVTLGYLHEDYDDDIESGQGGRNETVSLTYKLKF